MLKDNKITRIILGIALIGIWGLVIYRVIDAMKGKDIPNTAPITYWIDTTSEDKNENYELHLGYNDPFLKTGIFQAKNNAGNSNDRMETQISSTSIPPTTTIENLLPTKAKKINFPTLKYLGVVTNKSTGQQLAIIKHDNKIYRIKEGEKVANSTIFLIDKDSIQINFQNTIKSIRR